MAKEFGYFPDETYGPDDFTNYFRDFYSNGIMAEDTSYFAVSESIGMTLTVASGIAYIDGHFYRPQDNTTVTLAESDTEFPRIDLIEIKCDYVTNKLYVDVVTGEPSGTPTIPQLQRDVAAYCLGLAAVTVAANASEITQADIKDLRFDTDYCGIVVGKIDTISTKRLFAQYEAQWELLVAGMELDEPNIIKAFESLNVVKTINSVAPVKGNVPISMDNIYSGKNYPKYTIQCGVVTFSSNEVEVVFEKPFKKTPVIFLTGYDAVGSSYYATVFNASATGFTAKCNVVSTVSWLAIGDFVPEWEGAVPDAELTHVEMGQMHSLTADEIAYAFNNGGESNV